MDFLIFISIWNLIIQPEFATNAVDAFINLLFGILAK
jgi:hypothetical protein